MKNKILFLTSLVLIFTSCSRKEVNIREHMENTNSKDQYKVQSVSHQAEIDSLIYQNRKSIYNALETNNKILVDDLLKKYFDVYIQKFFYTANNLSADIRIEVTDLINNLILQSSDPTKYSTELLSHVYYGCDKGMNGCVKYDLYPKVKSSIKLIVRNIKSNEFSPESSGRILSILNSNRGVPDPELFLLIMENKDSLDEFLKNHPLLSLEGKNITDLAINQVKSKSESSREFRKRYCQTALDTDLIGGLESPLKTYSQKENTLEIMIYCKKEISIIFEDVKKRLDMEMENEEDSFLSKYSKKEVSFYEKFDVKKNLIKKDGVKGYIELFVIDRYFSDKISLSVASELINEFGSLNDLEALRLIDNYIKSHFAFRTDFAFNSLANELQDSIIEKDGLSSALLVDVTQNVARSNYEHWTDSIKSFGRILEFVNRNYGAKINKNSFNSDARKIYFALNKKLDATNIIETIKQNVEQPMHLFLTYFLSKLTGQVKFYFSWITSVDKYITLEAKNALKEYASVTRSLLGGYSFFQFTSDPLLRNSPLKVRSALFKAVKFGLFDKIPFEIEDIKNRAKPNALENAKSLMTQLSDDILQAVAKSRSTEYEKMKRKYLSRKENGLNQIKKYCANPFDEFLSASLLNLNSSISIPSSASGVVDKAPLVFQAYNTAISRSSWSDWTVKRQTMTDYLNMITMAKPELKTDLVSFSNEVLKKYEAPYIKINVLKKRLRDEILGSNCLEKISQIEDFRVKVVYNQFNTYFRKLYLIANISKLVFEEDKISQSRFNEIVENFVRDKEMPEEKQWLFSRIETLFTDEKIASFFGIELNNDISLISKSEASSFLVATIAHHNRELFADKLGFKASGIISVEKSKNFILQNFIAQAGSFVSISKWELYLKAQNIIENFRYSDSGSFYSFIPKSGKIFPEVLFESLGQNSILQTSSSNGSSKVNLEFSKSLDSFLKQAYSKVFGVDQGSFFTWFKPSAVKGSDRRKFLKYNYKSAMNNFKTGPIPLDPNWATDCFKDKKIAFSRLSLLFNDETDCKKEVVTAAEVINKYKEYLLSLKLTQEDLITADQIEAQSLYGDALYDEVNIVGLKSHEWRWFDKFYYTEFASYQTVSGSIKVNIDVIPDGDVISSYITEVESSGKEEMHVLYHPEFYQFMRNQFKYDHYEKMDKIFRIENAIFELEKKEKLGILPIEKVVSREERELVLPLSEVFPDLSGLVSGEIRAVRSPELSSGSDQYEYLARNKGPYPWFWGNYALYHEKQSDCYLLPRKGDFDDSYFSEAADQEDLSCRLRSKSFIDDLRLNHRGFGELVKSL